jgi:hypothetical protein
MVPGLFEPRLPYSDIMVSDGKIFFLMTFGIKGFLTKKRHIILFLDNATSHSHELQLSNVKLSFLPANCTSKLQPLNLGIIHAFRARIFL